MNLKCRFVFCLFLMGFAEVSWSKSETEAGRDVVEVFARALRGEPLTYVAMGGSITQAGQGWIGDWLTQQFPKSKVTAMNSGMSATGSDLGIFRVERDVIAHKPDLVALEFCVNDGGTVDEDVIHSMETLIVRLKSLPNPPAIIIYEAAAESGVNLKRHRRIAEHYGFFEVDLQKAVNEYLKSNHLPWKTLFSDDVHPNAAGDAFYAKIIAEKLEPLVQEASELKDAKKAAALPPLLSTKPLLLDARMIPLKQASGWSFEPTLSNGWNQFFEGVIRADQPRTTLQLPFKGTTAGLFFSMGENNGCFYASVDGTQPVNISTNYRGGFGYTLLAKDLKPQVHVIDLALPPETPEVTAFRQNGAIQLGYLLVGGESQATAEKAAQGFFNKDELSKLKFSVIPAASWSYSGPFPLPDNLEHSARPMMESKFGPEQSKSVDWKPVPAQEKAWIDFAALSSEPLPAIAYASASIEQDQEELVLLGFSVDYYSKLWVNGELIADLSGNHGNPFSPILFPVKLRAGKNDILVKVGSGSKGFGFSISLGRMN